MVKKTFSFLKKLFLISLIDFFPFFCYAVAYLREFDPLINFLASLIASFGIIMLLLAGYSFLTAEGDPGKLEQARNKILWGVIGIGIAFLARALVEAI